jgi:hypothetical protein
MNAPKDTSAEHRATGSPDQQRTDVDPFQGLTHIPGNLIDTIWGGEAESREAISEMVAARIAIISQRQEISEWAVCEQVAEKTGLSLDVVLSFMRGDMDLRDSLPLTLIQGALGVRLCDL